MMGTCDHAREVGLDGLCARCEDAAHDAAHPQPVDGCFACKVSRIHLGFTWGREDFHGPTITERQREQERVCAEDGVKAEPVGSRWV